MFSAGVLVERGRLEGVGMLAVNVCVGACLKLDAAALLVIDAPKSRPGKADLAFEAGPGDEGVLKDPKMLPPLNECDLNSPGELLRVGLPAGGRLSGGACALEPAALRTPWELRRPEENLFRELSALLAWFKPPLDSKEPLPSLVNALGLLRSLPPGLALAFVPLLLRSFKYMPQLQPE